MGDALADAIAEACIAKAFAPSEAHAIGTIAADIAREWMEGKAVLDGKEWRLRDTGKTTERAATPEEVDAGCELGVWFDSYYVLKQEDTTP